MRELPELRDSARLDFVRKKDFDDEIIFKAGTMIAMMVVFAIMFFVLRAEGDPFPFWIFLAVELFSLFYIFLEAFSLKISLPGYKVYEIQVVDRIRGEDLLEEDASNRVKDIDGIWLIVNSDYIFKKLLVGETYRVVIHNKRIKSIYDEL